MRQKEPTHNHKNQTWHDLMQYIYHPQTKSDLGGWEDPSDAYPRIPQQAGGTHPTGMHSCLMVNSSATMTQLEFVAYK